VVVGSERCEARRPAVGAGGARRPLPRRDHGRGGGASDPLGIARPWLPRAWRPQAQFVHPGLPLED